jgi:hypothetical protein
MKRKRKASDELTMTHEEAILDRQLSRAMKQETIHVDRHDAPVTLDKVDERLVEFHSTLIARCVDFFAVRYRRIKLQQFLHRLQAADDAPDEALASSGPASEPQQELPFPDIEEFRGIQRVLTLINPETGKTEYVNYREKSNEKQRAAMLEFKDASIAADQRSREKLARANRFCSSLVKIYGDVPPVELLKLKTAEEEGEAGAGSA